MVINSAFAFPLPAYEAAGEQLVVSGKRGGVMSGNSRSETLNSFHMLPEGVKRSTLVQ